MKQAIILRSDLDMSQGKAVTQGSHVSVLAVEKCDTDITERWWNEFGGTKITLQVSSEKELRSLFESAEKEGLPTSLIRDEGRTELEQGTATAVAVGPASNKRIDLITGDLELF